MKRCAKKLPVILLFALSGCASINPSTAPKVQPVKTPDPISVTPTAGVSKGTQQDETLEPLDDDLFIASPLQSSDPLPDIRVKKLSFSNGSPYDLMRQILAGTGLSFVESDEASSIKKRSVSAVGVSGKLEEVLNGLSDTAGFYWQNKANVIYVYPERQYIAKLPPVNEVFESLPQMIKTLGGDSVFLDKSARTITYRADKPAQEKINSYLEYIRDSKSLIVYDTYIWQVSLNKDVNTGIQWNNFQWSGLAANGAPTAVSVIGGGAGTASNGLGFGAVYSGAHFAMNVLANFLATQGTLQTISQPKLNLISGGTATFRNGNDTNYVSGISAPTVGPNGQVIGGMTTTSILQTGMQMTLSGDIADGTIYTNVSLTVKDLLGFAPYPAGAGQTLSLPNIANREVNTTIRALSNDTILLAGINGETNSETVAGLPVAGRAVAFPTQNDSSKTKTELVIVLKPHVIRFSRKKEEKKEEKKAEKSDEKKAEKKDDKK